MCEHTGNKMGTLQQDSRVTLIHACFCFFFISLLLTTIVHPRALGALSIARCVPTTRAKETKEVLIGETARLACFVCERYSTQHKSIRERIFLKSN